MIANTVSYPVISWLNFTNACQQWNLIDKSLTQTDIDRIFITVNFEEEQLEANDDSSLCRFEFLEIIVRMAKEKYYEKGKASTIAEATKLIIETFIVPNPYIKMSG